MEEKYMLLIIGFIVGAGVAFLWVKQNYTVKNATLQANLENLNAELGYKSSEISGLNTQIEGLKTTITSNDKDIATKHATIGGFEKELLKLQEQFDKLTV